jgi:hypothetical protein
MASTPRSVTRDYDVVSSCSLIGGALPGGLANPARHSSNGQDAHVESAIKSALGSQNEL